MPKHIGSPGSMQAHTSGPLDYVSGQPQNCGTTGQWNVINHTEQPRDNVPTVQAQTSVSQAPQSTCTSIQMYPIFTPKA